MAAREQVTQYGYMADRSSVISTWVSGNTSGLWVKGSVGKSDVCFFVNGRTSLNTISFSNVATSNDIFNSLSWYDGYEYNKGAGNINIKQKYLGLLFTN